MKYADFHKGPTPGDWQFMEAEPAESSYWEPPIPGYPPCIWTEGPNGEEVKIAELETAIYEIPRSDVDGERLYENEYDEGFRHWGDENVNGRLLANAKAMWAALKVLQMCPSMDYVREHDYMAFLQMVEALDAVGPMELHPQDAPNKWSAHQMKGR